MRIKYTNRYGADEVAEAGKTGIAENVLIAVLYNGEVRKFRFETKEEAEKTIRKLFTEGFADLSGTVSV